MSVIALVSFLATLTSGMVVGIRLLAVARRTHKAPEFAIGLFAVFTTAAALATLALTRPGVISPATAVPLGAVSRIPSRSVGS